MPRRRCNCPICSAALSTDQARIWHNTEFAAIPGTRNSMALKEHVGCELSNLLQEHEYFNGRMARESLFSGDLPSHTKYIQCDPRKILSHGGELSNLLQEHEYFNGRMARKSLFSRDLSSRSKYIQCDPHKAHGSRTVIFPWFTQSQQLYSVTRAMYGRLFGVQILSQGCELSNLLETYQSGISHYSNCRSGARTDIWGRCSCTARMLIGLREINLLTDVPGGDCGKQRHASASESKPVGARSRLSRWGLHWGLLTRHEMTLSELKKLQTDTRDFIRRETRARWGASAPPLRSKDAREL
ncbi:hypothetical protein B0H14DRAFT_2598585 [Mycena olivaceomarginata]|nr:hypothetical protein B0H14DRAFT_2598585 [Mycena olivaceomarginata]